MRRVKALFSNKNMTPQQKLSIIEYRKNFKL